jgi:cytoskeletal protein CcmA (bactofilin family)
MRTPLASITARTPLSTPQFLRPLPALLLCALTASESTRAEVSATIAHQGRLVADGLNFTGSAYFKFQIYQADAGPLEPAVGEASIFNGRVTSVRLLHGGKGYTVAPAVTLDAPTSGLGSQATARANIAGGAVTSFTVLTAGSGYTAAPGVKVAVPAGMSPMWSSSINSLPGRDPSEEPPAAVTLSVSGGLYNVALGDTGLTNMRALAADLVPDPGRSAWLRVWVGTVRNGPVQELFPHQPVSPVAYARHAATADSAATLLSSGPSTLGLLVTGGAQGAGAIPVEGEGARLMWYSAQRAFRAGYVNDNLVDPDGDGSSAGAWDVENIGRFSTAMGDSPVASGQAATAFGNKTVAEGFGSFAAGSYATANESSSAALGLALKTDTPAQTVVGKWNAPAAGKLFVVGGGTGETARKNVFTVSENGDARLDGAITASGGVFTGNIISTGTIVIGAAQFNSDVTATQKLTANGAFRVNDNATITGNATVSGSTTIGGNATISGDGSVRNLNISQGFTAAGDGSVKTLTITGGADIAEPFDLGSADLEPGTVLVIDDTRPGRLRESTEASDRRVAGVISGAGGIQPGISLSQPGVNAGGHQVALAGRVYVKADAATGAIRAGDLLTTSATPGHAMRAGDSGSHGAILGKAMSSLPEGRGLVLVLVSLQ